MLKILLKNQLYALNSSFFYDRKKGKVRSKTSSAVFIGLYVLLMLFVAAFSRRFPLRSASRLPT